MNDTNDDINSYSIFYESLRERLHILNVGDNSKATTIDHCIVALVIVLPLTNIVVDFSQTEFHAVEWPREKN